MKKFTNSVLPMILLAGSGMAVGQNITNPLAGEQSSRQSTHGVGSMAISNNDEGSVLGYSSNGVGDSAKVGLELSGSQGEINFSSSESESDFKQSLQLSSAYAAGQIPITKLSGAKNASGIMLNASTTELKSELDGELSYVDKSETTIRSSSFSPSFVLGIGDFTVGATYRYSNEAAEFDVSFPVSDEESSSNFNEKYDVDYGVASLSGTYDLLDSTRLALSYTPKQIKQVKTDVKGANYTDNDYTSVGSSEVIAFGVAHRLPAQNILLTGGLARIVSAEEKKDGEVIDTYDAETISSLGIETKLSNFIPRFGIENRHRQDGYFRRVGLGTDILLAHFNVSADVKYNFAHYESDLGTDTDADYFEVALGLGKQL